MIGFAPAPEANPASCDVSLYELLVLLVPAAIAAVPTGPFEIAGRTVTLAYNGRGNITIWIKTPLSATQPGLTILDAADFKKTHKKKRGGKA